MEVSFQRNVKGSFMVVSGQGDIPEYEERMLRENQVMVLLSFFTICMNSQVQYWYDITGKTSFRDYVEQEGLSADLIRRFFGRLKTAFDRMNGYLIDPDHIIINPDMVYLERVPSDFRIFLTYYPLEKDGVKSGVSTLTEFLTEQIGQGDSAMTDLCFSLYDATLKEQDAFHAVLEVLKAYDVDAAEERPAAAISHDPSPASCGLPQACREQAPVRQETGWGTSAEAMEDFACASSGNQAARGRRGRHIRTDVGGGGDFQEADEREDRRCRDAAGNAYDRYGQSEGQAGNARTPAQIEEDPWGFDSEGDYEEPAPSILSRIGSFFAGLFASKKKEAARRTGNLLPVGRDNPNDLDFEYDQDDTLEQPTVLLSAGTESGSGKLLYEGAGSEKDYVLSKEVFRIGSLDEENDAVLHSPVVSRRHARITKSGDAYFIEDLNSRNGTYVNGKMLAYRETQKLQRMDIITFADVVYRFV